MDLILRKIGLTKGQGLQEIVSSLNFCPSSRPGTGSPAMRLMGPLPCLPMQLPPEQLSALRLRHKHLKDWALKRCNARPELFEPGQKVLLYAPRFKRYNIPAVFYCPILGDDDILRSYRVITEDGVMRHYQAHWLITARAAEAAQ